MQTKVGNTETLNGIVSIGSDLWAVGDLGGTFRQRGSGWTAVPSSVTDPLWSLWGRRWWC